MWSPSISTSSNGNCQCAATICAATSYSYRSPVPLSPMTANRSASAARAGRSCRSNGHALAATISRARMTGRITASFHACGGGRRAQRPRRGAVQPFAFGDLGQDPADEALRFVRRIAAGAKCVAPLLVAETGQQIAGPLHIGGGDALLQQLLVPSVIVELDVAVAHAVDEALLLEQRDVVALRRQPSGLAERRAEIAHHIPDARRLARRSHLV